MVYDERSNYVGDTHWREDYHFEEGEEVELERGGILVQVAECVGRRDQDLSELLDKRLKEREERNTAKTGNSGSFPPSSRALTNSFSTPSDYSKPSIPRTGLAQVKSKSLNALLGTPSGRYGRAIVLDTSPFEMRQRTLDENENNVERPAKRHKKELTSQRNGYAQNLIGTPLTLSAMPTRNVPLKLDRSLLSKSKIPHDVGILDLLGHDENKARVKTSNTDEGQSTRRKKPDAFTTTAIEQIVLPDLGLAKSTATPLSNRNKGEMDCETVPGSGSSISLKDDGFVDIDELVIKSHNGPTEKSQRRQATPEHSGKPLKFQHDNEFGTESISCTPENVLQEVLRPKSLGTILQPEQNVNPLRIRSRSRKKLLYMSRIPPGPEGEPTGRNPRLTDESQFKHDGVTSPVHSQATLRLDAFAEKQRVRLQARINENCQRASNEKQPSSNEDVGLDHQAIDDLLSRRDQPRNKKIMKIQSHSLQSTALQAQRALSNASFLTSAKETFDHLSPLERLIGQDLPVKHTKEPVADVDEFPVHSVRATSSPSMKVSASTVTLASCMNITAGNVAEQRKLFRPPRGRCESDMTRDILKPNAEHHSGLSGKKAATIIPQPTNSETFGGEENCIITSKGETLKPTESVAGPPLADLGHSPAARLTYPKTRNTRTSKECDSAGRSPTNTEQLQISVAPAVLPTRRIRPLDIASKLSLKETYKLPVPPFHNTALPVLVGTTLAQPVVSKLGPWSPEAYDLMGWRPKTAE